MDDEEITATAFVLDHRTCRLLLITECVGRLVIDEPSLTVVPVRYTVTGDRVAIVGIDGAIPPGQPDDHVVLEVDGIDETRQAGWSVVIRGRLAPSASTAMLDLTEPELTGRWVSAPRPLPPLDGRAYL